MTRDELRQAVVFAARFEFYGQQFIHRVRGNGKPLGTAPGTALSPEQLASGEWQPVVNAARRREYWRRVLPTSWSDAQVDGYAKTKAWCGCFTLWCLREAGLAANVFWLDGRGYVSSHLKQVRLPEPGDVAYFKNFQHHALVEAVRRMPDPHAPTGAGSGDPDYEFDSVDGNQPAIELRPSRPTWAAAAFYSISPLLDALELP